MGFPFTDFDKHLRDIDRPIWGTKNHKVGLVVPEIVIKHGSFVSRFLHMPRYFNYMIGCMLELKRSQKGLKHNPYGNKMQMRYDERMALESFIHEQGVSDIGYVALKQDHLFRDSVTLFDKAMVFTMEMKADKISKAPSVHINDDMEGQWIQDFCDSCNACVKKCPSGAIYKEPLLLEDGTEQHIDYVKCAGPFSKQHGCTICIKECVFFKSDYTKIKNKAVSNT